MPVETENELFKPLSSPIGGKSNPSGDIKTDIMLTSLLVKMLNLIEASGSSSYDNLKNICEQEMKKLKVSLQNKMAKTTATKNEKSKLSPEDQQFVIDTLMSVISGKKETQIIFDKSDIFGDYLQEALANWEDKNEDTSCLPF